MMKIQAALILVALALSGCFLLSPDTEEQTMLLSIEARTTEGTASKVSPCADPVALLNKGPLHALATVVELDPQQELSKIVAEGGLEVGPDNGAGVRELTGDLAIPIGEPGLDYRLDVILLYDDFDNRSPGGSYFGLIEFDTGLSVNIDNLRLVEGQTRDQFAGTATVRFRNTDPVSVDITADFDSANNQLALGYQQPDVDFEGELRTAEVEMLLSFDSTPIYRGSAPLGSLQAGVNVEAEIDLVPFGTPTLVAHSMSGSIRVGFVDSDELTEEGTVRLTRSDFECDSPTF